MVNAQNLKSPPPMVDTKRLVELGLLDPVFDSNLTMPGLFPQGGGLGFQEQGFNPTMTQSPQQNYWSEGYLQDTIANLANQQVQRPSQIANIFKQKSELKAPELVKPKGITDSQAGIGGGIALLLRALGASHESVTGAFGNFLGGVVKRNADEANEVNSKALAGYNAQVDALNNQLELIKLTAPYEKDAINTAQETLKTVTADMADVAKSRVGLVTKATEELAKLMTPNEKGQIRITPKLLEMYAGIITRNGGQIADVSNGESYEDLMAEAIENEKKLGFRADSEDLKLVKELEAAEQISENRKLDGELKTINVALANKTFTDEVAYSNLKKRKLELEVRNMPEQFRQAAARVAQGWGQLAIAQAREKRIAAGGGSGDYGYLEKDVRDWFNTIRDKRQKDSNLGPIENNKEWRKNNEAALTEQTVIVLNLISKIPDAKKRDALVQEGLSRGLFTKADADQVLESKKQFVTGALDLLNKVGLGK